MQGTDAHPSAFLRIKDVLQLVPVSRSHWWAGVKDGRFPAAIKLSPKVTCWKKSDIDAFLARQGK